MLRLTSQAAESALLRDRLAQLDKDHQVSLTAPALCCHSLVSLLQLCLYRHGIGQNMICKSPIASSDI